MYTELAKTTNCPCLWDVCPSKMVCCRADINIFIEEIKVLKEEEKDFLFNAHISMLDWLENCVYFYHLYLLCLHRKKSNPNPANSVASYGPAACVRWHGRWEVERGH